MSNQHTDTLCPWNPPPPSPLHITRSSPAAIRNSSLPVLSSLPSTDQSNVSLMSTKEACSILLSSLSSSLDAVCPSPHDWHTHSMKLHQSTSKHWSDHTLLYYISWMACTLSPDSKQSSFRKVATLHCSGTSTVERTPINSINVRTVESQPSYTNDSRLRSSDFTSAPHSMTYMHCYP